ncbi:MAG: hypothetical protein V2J42_09210 [Wenzhouxiangella sp.]|jgi:ElaB/YqjD/DUF883 family membrane-anchored ribosome-binding protein|nr:hypothetical protein [Wenzhouxiangella sp.]
MTTATDKELKELREEFASLKSDVSEIGQSISKMARDAASESGHKLRDAAEEGRERLSSAARRSGQQVRRGWDSFESEIEDRPMTSLAVALGLGFILGRLLDR